MKHLLKLVVGGAVVAVCLVGAASASAATEFGSNCVANEAETEPVTITALQSSESLPIAAPSSGVITSVRTHIIGAIPFAIPASIKVLQPVAGTTNGFTVTAQESVSFTTGNLTANTRLPVQAGDHIGMSGEQITYEGETGVVTLYCHEAAGATLGYVEEDLGAGRTSTFESDPGDQVPLVAVVEPDADGDGYGDETQDKCPQSAATHEPCPTVVLNTSASAKRGFATVVVTSSVQASVTVVGKVKLSKGKTAKLSGGTQVVAPGSLAKFTVPFTGKLKSALKKLSRKQKLKVNLTASAPNVVGAPTVSNATVKLKGQTKPKRHKKS